MIDPVGSKVYIAPIFEAEKTASGIYIPDQAKERCNQGIVKQVGPDVKNLAVGDYVIFPNFTGTIFYVDSIGHTMIVEEDFITAKLLDTVEGTEVPGIYFQDEDGKYWTATYSMIFHLVSKAIQEQPWYQTMRLNRKRGVKETV